MAQVASTELHDNTAAVLERVRAGEDVEITVDGQPVARLTPIQPKRRSIPKAELIERLNRSQADPGLTADLKRLAGETTDDLDPLW